MLKLETKEDLETLHKNQVQESSTLEYKASPVIDNTDTRKQEIAKDISAMANAEGGQFVFGMAESAHLPAGLDAGMIPTTFNGLWFEQVIQQNVRPSIEGVKILQIPVGNGNVATVVTVPKSKTVHQTKDGRYYRRRNFRNDIMQDYEIREAMNRNIAPELYLLTELLTNPFPLIYQPGSQYSNPVTLSFHVGNRSSTPALYTLVSIHVDVALKITSTGIFKGPVRQTTDQGRQFDVYTHGIAVPEQFPIFKEVMFALNDRSFHIAVPEQPPGKRVVYSITALIRTPGFSAENRWELVQLNDEVTLKEK
jgi:Putative DNA-binding domain